jgi:hypothetical protein
MLESGASTVAIGRAYPLPETMGCLANARRTAVAANREDDAPEAERDSDRVLVETRQHVAAQGYAVGSPPSRRRSSTR